jgi:methyl-accepting chemotaxis protein/methyl-accepting chemotaxis protein-1 (serine sensor receptor)
MQGAQRGLMLSYAMNDAAASQQYVQLYASSGKRIDVLAGELRATAATAGEKAGALDIQDSRARWAPRFQKLIELCQAGQITEAYRLRNENKVISAKMHAAATELVTMQRKALDRARVESEAVLLKGKWIAILIAVLCSLVSLAMFVTIRSQVAKLRHIVRDLTEGASGIANASSQTAASSLAVAKGASNQAASVEETSAAAEQITAMTRQNAACLREAADLTGSAGEAVEGANRSLDEMKTSMREINAACKKVGSVIRVIDDIAFQTNILALNAAVESARAGEAGLGFAVVAAEVRNLAQRSANAASETTAWIEESIVKSNQGREHLDHVSEAIGTVTGSARRIAALVDGVRAGSLEQTLGMEQIASAMAQIGQSAQSSAAAAEQTAAVGKEMSAEATALNEIAHGLHFLVG